MGRMRGFTLLEMLVVLALLAMLAGLVAPRASRWLEGAQERGWRDDLRARVEMLPLKAFQAGEPLVVDVRQLQEGLSGRAAGIELRLASPLRYSASGMALGGELELRQGARRERWLVLPVSGEIQVQEP